MELWYENMTLTDICQTIRNEINATCESFVSIGYFLKQVRDRELYRETGHDDIWEFAQAQFGISKSSASRFMNINDRFSAGGNSPNLLEQYQNFSSSQLSEMLTLSDNQIEHVTEQTTVKEIRSMKPKKGKEQEVVQEESACSFYNKFASCDNCAGLHSMLKCTDRKTKRKFVRQNVKELNVPRKPDMRGYDMDEPYCPVCGEILNGNSVQCSFCGQRIEQSEPDALEKEEVKKINVVVAMSQQSLETEEPDVLLKQPELPKLTNNEKRGQFIDAYETWPLWIESELTGERYYRYDIEEGIAIVVRVSLRHVWLREKGKYSQDETEYGAEEYYLIGLNMKYTTNGYQFQRNGKKTFWECKSNRSELIEFLKKYQKGEITG